MSVFTAGASDTNAKLVRSLAHSLKTSSGNCKPLLDHCRSQNAFSAVSASDTEHFFNTVTSTLTSANESVASLYLQVLFHGLSSIPPYLLRPHWLQAAQKLTSLLKSSKSSQDPRFQAKLLTTMAAAVSSAAPFPVLQPEMKAVVSKVCQSALFHALRALQPTQVADSTCKAALCLIFAVLSTAPREVRTILSQLEAGIRERLLFHRNSGVRNIAVLLSAHLQVCHADKTRIKVFEERLNEACKQLDDVMNIIDMYGPSDGERRPRTFAQNLQKLSLPEMQLRVSTVCTYIRRVVELQQNVLMPMPLATLYRTLLRGIEERCVDAYATQIGTPLLDTDGVFLLINTVTVECTETLVTVTEACGKDAAMVFIHHIGRCLETKLSHVVLRSRTEAGVSSSVSERRLMYRMVRGLTDVMGCGLVEYVSGMLEELFSVDVKLHIACKGRHALLGNEKTDITEGNNRSRKRKRYQNQEGRPKALSRSRDLATKSAPLNSLDEHCAQNAYTSKETLREALRCAIAVFESRSYLSAKVSEDLQKVEHGVLKLMKEGVMFEEVIHAASAAGLSGGCNRMYGEASELLFAGSRACGSSLTEFGDARLRREARRSRSGFESIIHARGPSFCVAKRLCDQPIGEKVVVTWTENKRPEEMVGDGERENDVEVARVSRAKDGDINSNGESKGAGGVTDTAAASCDGNNPTKFGEDVDMTVADDDTMGVLDGRVRPGVGDVRENQVGTHGHGCDGTTRDDGTCGDKGGDHEGHEEGHGARESVTTTENEPTTDGHREGNVLMTDGHGAHDLHEELRNTEADDTEIQHAGAQDAEAQDAEAQDAEAQDAQTQDGARDEEADVTAQTAKARDSEAQRKCAPPPAAGDDASRMADGVDARAQPCNSGQVARGERVEADVEEEEDEEELIQSLNFAPPDDALA